MPDTNSILYNAGISVRDSIGTANLFATKVELNQLVDQQVSGAILALNNRMALLEGGGGTQTPPSLTSSPVTWTNISEIGVSGEKLLNASFDDDTINSGDVRRVTSSWENGGVTTQVGDFITLLNITAGGGYRWSRETSVAGTYPIGTRFVMLTDHSNKGLSPGDFAQVTGITGGGNNGTAGNYLWSGTGTFKADEENTTWELASSFSLEESLQSPYVSVTFNKTLDTLGYYKVTSITVDDGTSQTEYTPNDNVYDQIGVVNGNFAFDYYNTAGTHFLSVQFGSNDVGEILLYDDGTGDSETIALYTENETDSTATKSSTSQTDIFFSSTAQATNQTERVSLNYGLAPNMYDFSTFTNDNSLDRKVQILTQSLATQGSLSLDELYVIDNINGTGDRVHIAITGTSGFWLDHEDRGNFGRVRGVDWEFVQAQPDNWSVISGEIDESKLANGTIDGKNQLVIQQTFALPIPADTTLTVTINRPVVQTSGETKATFVYNDSSEAVILDNAVSNTATVTVPSNKVLVALKIHTMHGTREIESVSLTQGSIAGGQMEVSGNSITKIGGTAVFNAGASSVESIPGGQDGYFQFQYGGTGHVAIGVTYTDDGFSVPSPSEFTLNILENGTIYTTGYNSGEDFAPIGTWLRIRHYSGDNKIEFQRKQDFYYADSTYELPTTPNNGSLALHTFSANDRPLVIALQTTNGMTEGNIYRMHKYNTSNGNAQIYDLGGTLIDWIGGRDQLWEIAINAGQSYVTFHTSIDTTTNNDLFLDTSFKKVGSQINDATIAR